MMRSAFSSLAYSPIRQAESAASTRRVAGTCWNSVCRNASRRRLLRSTTPPVESARGRTVREVRRVGKQIAIGFEGDVWLAIHLKIAGRLHWRASAPKLGTKGPLAVFEFDSGVLTLTEAGTQHRA